MELGTRCHICGYTSLNPRCPRCNALKLASCTGSCMMCRNKKACDSQKAELLGGAAEQSTEQPEEISED